MPVRRRDPIVAEGRCLRALLHPRPDPGLQERPDGGGYEDGVACLLAGNKTVANSRKILYTATRIDTEVNRK